VLPGGEGGAEAGVRTLRPLRFKDLGSRIAAAFFVLIVSGENALAEVCDKTFPEGNGQYIDGTGFHWMLWLQGYRPVPLFIVIALLFLSFVVMRMRLRLLLLLLCSFMAAWMGLRRCCTLTASTGGQSMKDVCPRGSSSANH
jgi:hypothetical protein